MIAQAQISITICPTGPVLVSSGSDNKLNPELPDATFMMSRDTGKEAFVIPGSSLKGVMRHYLYKSNSEAEVDDLFGYIKKSNHASSEPHKSAITVSDAFADMSTVETTIRYSTAVGSVSQSASRNSLNNLMAVIKGDFHCNISVSSMYIRSEDFGKYLRMTLNAIQGIDSGEVCIGGRISRGFGRMKISDFRMTVTRGYDENFKPVNVGCFDSLQTAVTALNNGL